MTFTILKTQTTPQADFREGCLVIRGKSVPFDHPEFYDTLQERLNQYALKPAQKTKIDFHLTAVNAVSKRSIVRTFSFLENWYQGQTDLQINWYYEPDDEDIYELGEFCRSCFKLKIRLHASA